MQHKEAPTCWCAIGESRGWAARQIICGGCFGCSTGNRRRKGRPCKTCRPKAICHMAIKNIKTVITWAVRHRVEVSAPFFLFLLLITKAILFVNINNKIILFFCVAIVSACACWSNRNRSKMADAEIEWNTCRLFLIKPKRVSGADPGFSERGFGQTSTYII